MRFLCIGEPLAEFTNAPDLPHQFNRAAGGDTLNSAIYLARLFGAGQVAYLSRLGDDAMSLFIREVMADEGVVDLSCSQSGGRLGLSMIATDAAGERSFTYWRDQSPARHLFQSAQELALLDQSDVIILSGITLAVLYPEGRAALVAALQRRAEAGALVVLDTNYRPRLWPDAATAAATIGEVAKIAGLVLPSLDDMAACFGTQTAGESMKLLQSLTKAEVVLTTGGADVLYRAAGEAHVTTVPLPPKRPARDTTGAGDSFNAGWLHARAQGASVAQAITQAAELAAEVVCHPGAVIPKTAMAAFMRA